MKKINKDTILNIILVVGIVGILVSGFMVGRTAYLSHKHQKNFKKISSLAPLPPINENDTEGINKVTGFFDSLKAQNPDISAYIKIPDTQIDYPVMLTPDDEEYYLRRDFNKKYSYYGTPFFETDASSDGGVKIIYGHHITGKKMFGELLYYESKSYMMSHKDVHLYDENGDNAYTVFASFYTTGDDKHGIYTKGANGLYNKADFDSYINQIKAIASAYNTEVNLEIGDEILLLSTCEYSQHVGRFVVAAVKNK